MWDLSKEGTLMSRLVQNPFPQHMGFCMQGMFFVQQSIKSEPPPATWSDIAQIQVYRLKLDICFEGYWRETRELTWESDLEENWLTVGHSVQAIGKHGSGWRTWRNSDLYKLAIRHFQLSGVYTNVFTSLKDSGECGSLLHFAAVENPKL